MAVPESAQLATRARHATRTQRQAFAGPPRRGADGLRLFANGGTATFVGTVSVGSGVFDAVTVGDIDGMAMRMSPSVAPPATRSSHPRGRPTA